MADPKTTCFCFTLNNYSAEEEATIQAIPCKYLIYGHEVGSKKCTRHLQGYIQFTSQKRFKQVEAMLGGRAAIFRAKGDADSNIKYCSKDADNIFTKGEPDRRKGQGKRNDLEDAAELIQETKSVKEVALQYPTTFIKFHKGFKELVNVITEDRDNAPQCIYAWGDTGVGKTRSVCLQEKGKLFIKTDDGKEWFDFYDPNVHEALLIDEFRGNMKPEFINRLLDYAPMQVEVKGSYVKMLAKRVYFCSNYSFEEAANMGNWDETQKKTVKRRITKFVHVVKFPGQEFNDWLKPAEVVDIDADVEDIEEDQNYNNQLADPAVERIYECADLCSDD